MAVKKLSAATVSSFVPEVPQGVQVLVTFASSGPIEEKHKEVASGQAIVTIAQVVEGMVETPLPDGSMKTWNNTIVNGAGLTLSFVDAGLLSRMAAEYDRYTQNPTRSGAISFLALVDGWSVNAQTNKFVGKCTGIDASTFGPAAAEVVDDAAQEAAIMEGRQKGAAARKAANANRLATRSNTSVAAATAGVAEVANYADASAIA